MPVLFYILLIPFRSWELAMQSFIVIRNYRKDDDLKCQELMRDYIMSFANKSFCCFCFREITLQFIVITWAILFIFMGVPLTLCALTIPGCLAFLFSATYFSFYSKAVEMMRFKPSQSLVAECYEPLITRSKPNEANYQIFLDNAPYDESFKNKFRRKIVATVSVQNHNSVHNAAWMHRFALAPDYPFQKIVEPMIILVLKNCYINGYATLECTISEWQENERDLYENIGFLTRLIYHKRIIGRSLTVMKTQLTFNLQTIDVVQKRKLGFIS